MLFKEFPVCEKTVSELVREVFLICRCTFLKNEYCGMNIFWRECVFVSTGIVIWGRSVLACCRDPLMQNTCCFAFDCGAFY